MPDSNDPVVSTARLRALRSALGSGDKPLILAIHDYPDPDAISAAMAFQTLAGSWAINAVIAHGGGIGREDNAEMIRLLKIEMRSFASLGSLADYRGAFFLDTQPQAKNQSLPDGTPILGVVDHHHMSNDSIRISPSRSVLGVTRAFYSDVRLTVGSSSSLACGYLEAAGIVPDMRLATALFLGIKTDTDDLLRDANPPDIAAYTRLMALADLKLVSRIVHPPLTREYYRFLHLVVSNAVVYGPAVMVECGDVASPDILSTASDLLVAGKGVEVALAVGFAKGRAYLSLRARQPRNDATRTLLFIVGENGKGGGHGLSAGGFMEEGERAACLDAIRRRLLEAAGAAGSEGASLL